MKKVILIRHAKSDWSFPELADFERPLNKRGKKDAPEMGKRLAKLNEKPQIVYLSNSERTRETMKLLSKEAHWDEIDKIEKDWLYLASINEYVKTIEKFHDEFDHVCFCGHNPSITSVVNYLAGETIGNIPTCGVAIISFDVDSWKHVSKGSGHLEHYDFPKNL